MFDLVRKLMMARELRMEEGEISLLGERIQFVPTQIFVEILHQADDFWKQSYLMYESSKRAVEQWFEEVSKRKNLSGDELVKWQINIFNLSGWGIHNILASQLKKGRVSFITKNSAFGSTYLKFYGKQRYPVCHLIRGGIAAGANVLNNTTDAEVVELECIAQGFPQCKMVLKPRNEFLENDSELIKKQLNIDNCIFHPSKCKKKEA